MLHAKQGVVPCLSLPCSWTSTGCVGRWDRFKQTFAVVRQALFVSLPLALRCVMMQMKEENNCGPGYQGEFLRGESTVLREGARTIVCNDKG